MDNRRIAYDVPDTAKRIGISPAERERQIGHSALNV
jgi:hypothetical protein